jgi:hypothetical protein
MRWLVVRFRGRYKTPSIIDWDRQQRLSHRASGIESSAPITATASPRQATGRQAAHTGQATGTAGVRGRRKAVQRAGATGLSARDGHAPRSLRVISSSGPSIFVPTRNATRKTAGANILNVWGRAVPPFIHALRRTPSPMAAGPSHHGRTGAAVYIPLTD